MNNILKFLGAFLLSFLVACGGGPGPTPTPPVTTTYSISGTTKAGTTLTLSGQASAVTTADVNGGYSFPNLASGTYAITPSLPGHSFAPTSTAVTIISADFIGVNFTATPNPSPTYSLSGKVTGLLDGVTITLSPGGASTVTDPTGVYSFTNLANGSYSITPSFPGYMFTPPDQMVSINNANVSGVDFGASPNPVFVYSISGTTKAGATLTLSQGGTATASATADVNGVYSFPNLANGSYSITPSFPGYVFTPPNQTVSINNANVSGVDFGATPNPTFVYSISGTTKAGATLTLGGQASAVTTAGANGVYSFPNLANGTYVVTPSLSGNSFTPTSTTVDVAGADRTGVDFAATVNPTPTYCASGNVSGRVSSGVTITATPGGLNTISAANGNYSLCGLADGTYTLKATKTGDTLTAPDVSVTISGANSTGNNFVEPIPSATSGKIFYPGYDAALKQQYGLDGAIYVEDLSTGVMTRLWGGYQCLPGGCAVMVPEVMVPARNGKKVVSQGSNLNGFHVFDLVTMTDLHATPGSSLFDGECSHTAEASFDITVDAGMAAFSSRCFPGGYGSGLPERRDIILMKLDGSILSTHITNDADFDTSPAIGGVDAGTGYITVYFLSNKAGVVGIWKQVVDPVAGAIVGGQSLVVNGVVDGIRAISFNADYSKFAFMKDVGGTTHIFVYTVAGGTEVDLGAGTDPYWSTDGSNLIMYTTASTTRWAILPDGTGKVQIPIPSNIAIGNLIGVEMCGDRCLGNTVFGPAGY